jgi:hypothetical protein
MLIVQIIGAALEKDPNRLPWGVPEQPREVVTAAVATMQAIVFQIRDKCRRDSGKIPVRSAASTTNLWLDGLRTVCW